MGLRAPPPPAARVGVMTISDALFAFASEVQAKHGSRIA
jgi:hypothetical protein